MAEIPSDYVKDAADVKSAASRGQLYRSNQQWQRLQRATNIPAIRELVAQLATQEKEG